MLNIEVTLSDKDVADLMEFAGFTEADPWKSIKRYCDCVVKMTVKEGLRKVSERNILLKEDHLTPPIELPQKS